MVYPHSPLVALLAGIVTVVLLLAVLDLPAVFGLIAASLVVGLVAPQLGFGEIVPTMTEAFGNGMAGIGIPILMAAVIGKSMMESGAAERIMRGFTGVTGTDNADLALWGSSSVLAIPVFFDNVFYLLAPLARSMRARIGDNYVLYLVVVGAGAATTHVFVPPTPGPLAVASEIGVGIGLTILVGLAVALPSALVAGLVYGRWLNARLDIPLRDSMGMDEAEMRAISDRSNERLPGLLEALLPIILAVLLVTSNTLVNNVLSEVAPSTAALAPVTRLIGAPSVALTVAALVAAYTFYRYRAIDGNEWTDEIIESLKNGGHIAAITALGGAFGVMLAEAGIGDYIASGLEEIGIGLLLTAWLIAAAIRIAQGSATVAMLTTAGIMAPLASSLAVHQVYLVMAIGAGGNIFSWYPDSGFWLVKEIGGLTQLETLKTWTVLTTIISVTGMLVVLVLSRVVPLA